MSTLRLPKDHIRLIRILPRDGDDTIIRCQTLISPLSAGTQYLALSYTWGNPPESHSIEVDGKQFLIRKNLWRFLDQISDPSRDWQDLLWIDSISIDQTDADEKAHQIGLMGRIYEQACKVIIWLGPAYNQSDVAMKALVDFGRSPRINRKRTRFWSEAGGLALMRLCNRTYWTRLWVFQEIMLAKDIFLMCGSRVISWRAFYEVMAAVDGKSLLRSDSNGKSQQTGPDGFCQALTALDGPLPKGEKRNGDVQNALKSPALAMTRRKVAMAGSKEGLWNLMNATRGLECADPKDRIFALLGVADPKRSSSVTADYRTPLRHLLNAVLQTRHAEMRPSSIESVAIECGQLTDVFGLDPSSIYELENKDGTIALPEVKNVSVCPLGDPYRGAITLWWTTWYNHDAIQRLLLGDDKSPDELLLEAWIWAVKKHELPTMRHIAMIGKLDIPRYNDALHTVRTAGQAGRMKLEKSADMDTQDRNYSNTFQAACHTGQEELVEMRLQKGAKFSAEGGEYDKALYAACAHGHKKIAEMLIQLGADVNAQGGFHGHGLQATCFKGHEKVAEMLIREGADVNAQGGLYGNALQAACVRGYKMVAVALIENGADVNAEGGEYGNALQAALLRCHEKLAELLIQNGADVNAQGGYYGNALQAACARGYVIVADMLIRKGADVNARGGHYGKALQAAYAGNYEKVVELLIQNGAERSCLTGERAGSERDEASVRREAGEGSVEILTGAAP